jgi:Protein of unknown function (DUF4231)
MPEDFNYPRERIDAQIDWHSNRANWNKRRYYITEIITLVAAALIPVVNALEMVSEPQLRMLSASLGALSVLALGVSKLFKFQENWLNYRALAETVRREKELFFNAVGDYDVPPERRNKKLVERIEIMLASTTSKFISIHKPERDSSLPSTAPATSEFDEAATGGEVVGVPAATSTEASQ